MFLYQSKYPPNLIFLLMSCMQTIKNKFFKNLENATALVMGSKQYETSHTQLGVWRLWWFNYPGPLLEVELESACLSGQGCGLCIALIRPNHWAASVAQWLEHLSSKQCVVDSNPTRAALFSFRRKKSCLG